MGVYHENVTLNKNKLNFEGKINAKLQTYTRQFGLIITKR